MEDMQTQNVVKPQGIQERCIIEESQKPEEFDAFLRYLKKKGCSQNTILSYRCAVRGYLEEYESITVRNLEQYRENLLKRYKAASVNLKISAVNQFLKYLIEVEQKEAKEAEGRKGKRGRPNLSQKGLRKNLPEWRGYTLQTVTIQKASYMDNIISQEDYERLKSGLKNDEIYLWYFIVRFLAGTGARVSEVVQIKAEHVRQGYVDLYSKGGKVRRIYFPEQLTEEAREWLKTLGKESGFLFLNCQGKQITPRGINAQLKKLAVRYDIDPNMVYAHSFCHRFAKNFLQKTNDIALLADLMGHESIETTRIYLKKSSMEQRELIDHIVVW